jgi:hypothetical protein
VAFSPMLKENLLKFHLNIILAALEIKKKTLSHVKDYFPMKHIESSTMPNTKRTMQGLGFEHGDKGA